MKLNHLFRLGCSILASVLGLSMGHPAFSAERPNIVIILADDLGNADLGYRGSPIKTPHIDALARDGVRLESYYGLPVCTSARAALMTGRHPLRQGLQTLVIFPSHTYGLPTAERTLPQALHDVGYHTYMVGKWHLGHAHHKYWPQNRGFQHFYGNLVGEVDYFTKERGGIIDWQRNGKFLKEEGYYTDLIGNEAVRLIEQHDPAQPFFLYFSSLAAHAPYQAPQPQVDAYRDVFTDPKQRTYAAMISGLDTQVGRIVETLQKRGLRENTLIFFTTDNGGPTNAMFATGARPAAERAAETGSKPPCSNAPYSGGKGSLREGGVRLPAIVNWPGKLRPAVVNEPIHHIDVMPTLLALTGAQGDPQHPFDGKDVSATITEGVPSPHDDLLINVELFRGAIRRGRWKLIRVATLPGKTELFDVVADPGETQNLAEQHPDVVRDLETRLLGYAKQAKMSEWLKAQVDYLGAQSQTAFDPDYNIDAGLPTEKPALPQP
jgi:arylsulfatase A-like enzyme